MEDKNDLQPYIELLCGISHSGKTTFVKDRYSEGFDGVVLTRDTLVMNMVRVRHIMSAGIL